MTFRLRCSRNSARAGVTGWKAGEAIGEGIGNAAVEKMKQKKDEWKTVFEGSKEAYKAIVEREQAVQNQGEAKMVEEMLANKVINVEVRNILTAILAELKKGGGGALEVLDD